jgi:uncharacterized phage protein (TIGR02220 family)
MNHTIQKTVEYLNQLAGTDFSPTFPPTVQLLQKLIDAGYSYNEFQAVIDKKWNEWKGTKFQDYVRPSTLFGNNFENYLNERTTKTTRIQQLAQSVDKAKQANWKLD